MLTGINQYSVLIQKYGIFLSKNTMHKVLIYSRVSTSSQKTDRQITELTKLAESKGWSIIDTVSETISGTSDITKRKINSRIQAHIKNSAVDKILITEISRLGRKVSDAIKFIEDLSDNGITLYIQNISLETLKDNGKFNHMFKPILVTLASFAEMERELLNARIRSGLVMRIDFRGDSQLCVQRNEYFFGENGDFLFIDQCTDLRHLWMKAEVANELQFDLRQSILLAPAKKDTEMQLENSSDSDL